MASSPRPVFLPITSESARDFFEKGDLPPLPVERAALFAAQLLVSDELKTGDIEQLLASATDLFRDNEEGGAAKLAELRAKTIERSASIRQTLRDMHVYFARQEQVLTGAIDPYDNGYDFGFQKECRQPPDYYDVSVPSAQADDEEAEDEYDDVQVSKRSRTMRIHGTREQGVAANVIANAGDEHVALDAYAGTGKTHLIHELHTNLGDRFTYFAPYKSRIYGFEQHASARGMSATTLWAVATGMADKFSRRGHSWSLARAGKNSLYSEEEQAASAGITEIAGKHAVIVLRMLKSAVNSWCHGDASEIQAIHFSRTSAPQDYLAAYIAAANKLWQAMFSLSTRKGPVFDVTFPHLVKWLVINHVNIPSSYGTLLVDETHDLLPTWHQLFDRYSGACVLMGDPHQRVRGFARRHEHAKAVTMGRSVRLGLHGERLIERTLSIAPDRLIPVPFSGSSEHVTRLHSYGSGEQLPDHGFRIYGNEWTLLNEAIRLKGLGASFRFLPATAERLNEIVQGAVGLQSTDQPSPRAITGHYTWSTLAAFLTKEGKADVMQMLREGYKDSGWGNFLRSQASEGEQRVTLGLVEHTKNYETGVVVLNDCCFEAPLTNGTERYNPVNGAYLAMTRAKHELWVPGDAIDRLSDTQSAFSSSSRSGAKR